MMAEQDTPVEELLYSSSAVYVSAFADKVKAILYMGYGEEGVNEAAAKLLSGEAVPCGKLAESFPQNLRQTATGEERGNGYTERYREGVLVGYKYCEYYDLKSAYPFGHGLSYTRFEYGKNRTFSFGFFLLFPGRSVLRRSFPARRRRSERSFYADFIVSADRLLYEISGNRTFIDKSIRRNRGYLSNHY